MFFLGMLLSKWKIRAEIAFCTLLSIADPVLDVLVLMKWNAEAIEDSEKLMPAGYFDDDPDVISIRTVNTPAQFYDHILFIGVICLVVSGIMATLIYYRTTDSFSFYGLFFHLIGLGSVYNGYQICKNPIARPWNGGDELGAKRWAQLFKSRAVESALEALPFTLLQCSVMVRGQSYQNTLEMASMVISFICVSFPIAEFANYRCYDNGIATLNDAEKVILVLVWTIDILVRCVPLLYIVLRSERFWVTWSCRNSVTAEWELSDYDEKVVPYLYTINEVGDRFVVVLMVELAFSILFKDVSAMWLIVASYPKLRKVSWKYGLETFVRFAISFAFVVELYDRTLIHKWQVIIFTAWIIFSGGLQIYFLWRVNSGKYEGLRLISQDQAETYSDRENSPHSKESGDDRCGSMATSVYEIQLASPI